MIDNAQLLDDLRYCAEHCETNKAQFIANLREFAGLLIGSGCEPCLSPAPLDQVAVTPGGFRQPSTVERGTNSSDDASVLVRQLLKHGVGNHPFLSMLHAESGCFGYWVFACIASPSGMHITHAGLHRRERAQ